MSETLPRREHTGTVRAVAKSQKGEGWALSLEPREGMQYPDTFYGKNWDLVNPLKAGQHVTLVLERGRLKPDRREGSTNHWDYYENLLAVKQPATEAPVPDPVHKVTADARGDSIERQRSAKNRTELAIACIQMAVAALKPETAWETIINGARLAYDKFSADVEVEPPADAEETAPDGSPDDLPF